MFPPFNSQPHSNGGPLGSAPPQVMSRPSMQNQPPMFNPQGANAPNNQPYAQRFPFPGPQNPNNQISNVIPPQMPQQFYPQNVANPAQFFNPNVNFGMPNNNLLQTVNQLLQLQMQAQMQVPNFGQVGGPAGLPFYGNNQASQGVGRQNPAFNANAQFMHANGASQQPINGNMWKQQPQQGNAPPMNAFGMGQPPPNQGGLNRPDASMSQGDLGSATQFNTKGNWKSSPNNFNKNRRHDAPHTGFRKGAPHSHQNGKRNFKNHISNPKKGHNKVYAEKSFKNQNQVEKKRSLPFLYSEKEVRQWREDRRKNYPSNANLEKKSQKLAKRDHANAARLRRQQLREILAKQAELGCEVAEIPSSYLADRPGQEQKSNKRGQFGQKNHFSKRQKFKHLNSNTEEQNDDHNSTSKSNNRFASEKKREVTLLKKLLGADIRRDKQHLLQVFRFMVMNSFFKENPEKPLKFPSVIVKDSKSESAMIDPESLTDDEDFDIDDDEECKGVSDLCNGRENNKVEEHQEEGEING